MNIIRNFYSESDMRTLLSDYLTIGYASLPQVDKNGFHEKDGERYAAIGTWIGTIGVSQRGIEDRLKKSPLPGILAKGRRGAVSTLYPESEIRRICADLIAKKSEKQS